MPLASQAVEAIFGRMAVRYGAAWLAKWSGVPIDAVMTDWGRELNGLGRDAIVYALDTLPLDYPPTVGQFRALCVGKPDIFKPQLKGPASSDDVVEEAISKALAGQGKAVHPKDWAHRLREREKRREGGLTAAQRLMWRAALESEAA